MNKFKLIVAVLGGFLFVTPATTVIANAGGGVTEGPTLDQSDNNDTDDSTDNDTDSGSGGVDVANIQPKKLIIQSVTPSPEKIEPGQPFSLTFEIANISGSRMEGVSLKLANVEGKTTLEGFSPVGTTNEIYLGTIYSGRSSEVTINMIADPKLTTGVHNFNVSVTYNEPSKKQEEILKTMGIMIQGKPSVDFSDLQVFADPMMGTTVTGGIINDSNFKIKKTEVVVVAEGTEYNAYLGSIDSGGDSYFDVMLPSMAEETKGVVNLTFFDETNTEHTQSLEITIPATQMDEFIDPNGPGGEVIPEVEGGFWSWLKGLFGFVGA